MFEKYGFVFAIAHLSSMFASPIFGRYTGYMGPKCVYVTASVMQVTLFWTKKTCGFPSNFRFFPPSFFKILCAGYLFGLLDFVKDATSFLVVSYILRLRLQFPASVAKANKYT